MGRIEYIQYFYSVTIVLAMFFCEIYIIWITALILSATGLATGIIIIFFSHIYSGEFITSTFFSITSYIIICIASIISRKITDDVYKRLKLYADDLETVVEGRTVELKHALSEKESINRILKEKTEELIILKNNAENRARTDVLTGLNNRFAFIEYSAREIHRTLRYNHPLSVLIADIDHFKKINDTKGHAAGDNALQEFANCLKQELRNQNDFPARIGGEEFAIILPETNIEDACILAERIRAMIEKSVSVEDLAITCSIGVACLNNNQDTIEEILKRADIALYKAKNNGRNRVEFI